MASDAAQYEDILFRVEDGVAWLTLNRPKVLNAFREQTLDEIMHALRSTRDDPTIVAVVVTGTGRSFSAGGDFHAMMRLDRASAGHWNERMLGVAMTMRGLPIPVIAMVNGWCMGGGHELALWCDLVVASDRAIFGQTGAKVGACPTVGATQYIPRLIGDRLAKEMIFLGRTFDATEAARIGLINKVVPHDDLLAATLQWCATIKANSGQTIRATKTSINAESDMLYSSWRHGMELLGNIWGTPEALEGMNAFLEKRSPDFWQFREKAKAAVAGYLASNGSSEVPGASPAPAHASGAT